MDKELIDKFLNLLYFQSRTNFARGFSEPALIKLLGLNSSETRNITHYLEGKHLIDGTKGYGDNIVLSSDGIDYVQKLRLGKIFNIIRFKEVSYVPHGSKMVYGFLFPYDLIQEDGSVETKSIGIFASDILAMTWQLPFRTNPQDAAKILFQFAKNIVIEKLKEGTLNEYEELTLLSSNQPATCPYTADQLVDADNAEYEIEISSKPLMEEISENKLAASIIETRDTINAIFSAANGEKLLLLNQERNLLDFFKTAASPEEFSSRIASLADVSRNLNLKILRKLAGETDTTVPSVVLLEKWLNSINRPEKKLIEILRNIGRLRKGYPIHLDTPEVVDSHSYFKFRYPLRDYESAWRVLLNHYLESLRSLKEIVTDIYMPVV